MERIVDMDAFDLLDQVELVICNSYEGKVPHCHYVWPVFACKNNSAFLVSAHNDEVFLDAPKGHGLDMVHGGEISVQSNESFLFSSFVFTYCGLVVSHDHDVPIVYRYGERENFGFCHS